jgi:hypothetical protein
MLSCAVNCGVQTAIDIENNIYIPGKLPTAKDFCHHWLLHYAELVRKNAEAWRDYSIALEAGGQIDPLWIKKNKPATLRAENLAGWINRVMKYMP